MNTNTPNMSTVPAFVDDVEVALMQLLDVLNYVHPDDVPSGLADAVEAFDGNKTGLLSRNRGIVLQLRNGATFQLLIVQSAEASNRR